MRAIAALAAGAVVVLVGWSSPAVQAQDGAAAVEKRQATMKRMSGDLKTIKEYGQGQADQEKAIAAAQDVVATQKALADLFPKGTGSDALPGKSYANPKLWEEMDKFKSDNKIAEEKAAGLLAKVQAGDKEAAASGPADTWDNGCQVCHKSFREKKPS